MYMETFSIADGYIRVYGGQNLAKPDPSAPDLVVPEEWAPPREVKLPMVRCDGSANLFLISASRRPLISTKKHTHMIMIILWVLSN